MKVQVLLKTCRKQAGAFLRKNIFSFVVGVALIVLAVKTWNMHEISYNDIVETVKISVTVLISMLGFSVSIYVFLNNTFQSRRSSNELEKEVIDSFQNQKRLSLGVSIIFSVMAIFAECAIVAFKRPVNIFVSKAGPRSCLLIYFIIIAVTLLNVYKLGYFTCGVINYEEGLKKLAKKEINTYNAEKCYKKISKGEFLNLVNNVEVLIERLVQNHLHAKVSTAYDTNLKRAICDGITDPGDIKTRETLAKDYKEIIDYRNLLLQDSSRADSADVAMGDQVKSVMNRLFQNYFKNELLTGVNISNIRIADANLEKVSFCNSSLQGIEFAGNTNLVNADLRNSTINSVSFVKAKCENVNFSGCKLIDIKLNTKINLNRAIFANADLSSMGDIGPNDKEGDPIEFNRANFSGANMTHQNIYNVCFDFADFSNVRLVDSNIGKSAQKNNNTTFTYADMEKADLLRCVIQRSDFQNANLNDAALTYAKISDVNFSESRLNNTNFSESVIEKCKFEKSYCTNFSMKGTVVRNSWFTYAIMVSADMSGAEFTNVHFKDAVCRNTLWVRSKIKDSDFERCVLENARIVGDAEQRISISNCNFSYTDLSNSAIANIEFRNCNFEGADLSNARLINIRFMDCQNLDTVASDELWFADIYYVGQQKKISRKKGQKWRYERLIHDYNIDDGRCVSGNLEDNL